MPRYCKIRTKVRGAHLKGKKKKVDSSSIGPGVLIPIDNLELVASNSDSNFLAQQPEQIESPRKLFVGSNIDDLPSLVIETFSEKIDRELKQSTHGPPVGRRIVTVQGLEDALQKAKSHGKSCEHGILQIVGESKNGLHSTMQCECVGCRSGFKMNIDCDKGDQALPINDAGAWGIHCSKTNFTSASHLLTTMEIPFMSFRKYQKHEEKLIQDWEIALTQELKEVAEQERQLATEFVTIDGKEMACIDVCVDGGWGKRSYGHGMNSLGGVAVIVGIRSKKILFMGVRNKYCSICSSCERQNKEIPVHKCYKNWGTSASSTSMEADIILEGFKLSLGLHGLVYKRLLGDGDSSVFITVLSKVHYPGVQIEKIDCINHAEKRFNSKLYFILKQTKMFDLEDRKLLKKLLPRFGKALRGAIQHNHQNQPLTSSSTLKEDIFNIPFHIFGEHKKCKKYFCTEERKKEENFVPIVVNGNLWAEIEIAIARLANISNRLIHNLTSNLAERFMAQGAAFTLGKRLNLYQRGGYKTRMMGATFAYNRGAHFRSHLLEKVKKTSAPSLWQQLKLKYEKKKSAKKVPKNKRKPMSRTKNNDPGFHGDADYGSNPAEPDISDLDMNLRILELKQKLQITVENQGQIERKTVGQSENDMWIRERRKRITASSASSIYSMRDTTKNSTQLTYLLGYKVLKNVKSLDHGKKEEAAAIKAYIKETGSLVEPCGLVVSLENGIFACSPDGFVGENGIIEVKCPVSMVGYAPDKMITVKGKSASYLEKINLPNGVESLQLKRKHPYFRQVSFQLHVTERQWCDFVIYSYKFESTTKIPFPLFLERIYKNKETEKVWLEMEPKLSKFWEEDLAPEIVDSRYIRNLPFRQPNYRETAIEAAAQRKPKSVKVKPQNVKIKNKTCDASALKQE